MPPHSYSTLCGALAAIVVPPLTPILLAPAVVLAATARPAGLLLAPLAAALPMPLSLRVALLAAAGAAALAAALAEGHRRGLERRALVDPLTGLYRPEFFNEALEVELRRVHRYGGEVSLVLLDLDDFKQVNDRHGHAAGNEVLRQAGGVLRARRATPTWRRASAARSSCCSCAAASARRPPPPRASSRLRELSFADGLRVTCSAGVAALAEGGDSASLFASADEALYEAKRRGKDRVVLARRPASRPAARIRRGLPSLSAARARASARRPARRRSGRRRAAQQAVAGLDGAVVEERHVEVPRADDVERGALAGRAYDRDADAVVAAGGEADLRREERLAAALLGAPEEPGPFASAHVARGGFTQLLAAVACDAAGERLPELLAGGAPTTGSWSSSSWVSRRGCDPPQAVQTYRTR